MKKLLIIALLSLPCSSWAVDQIVVGFGDSGAGTLRAALYGACLDPGDDEILFAKSATGQFLVELQSPLVIPSDCDGAVILFDSKNQEVVLDGSQIQSGEGILAVHSWGNTVKKLTFVGYEKGAGLVLKDNDNLIEDNFFGVYRTKEEISPNRRGVEISSDWNVIRGNTVSANLEEGFLIEGHANAIEENSIGEREGSCPEVKLPQEKSDPVLIHEIFHENSFKLPFGNPFRNTDSPLCGNQGAGIRIFGDRNLIGGDQLSEGNRIVYNEGGGVIVEAGGIRNRFSRNVIAHNVGLGIEVLPGANSDIDPLDSLTAFPVESEPVPGESFKYTLMGHGKVGQRVELYLVAKGEEDDFVGSPSDTVDVKGHGEGAKYLEHFTASGDLFVRTLERDDLPPGSKVSAIVCDDQGNCSGFSSNAVLDRDSDRDGIPDSAEDSNQNQNVDTGESDPFLNDTDGDGLPDGTEDVNENGIVDSQETDSASVDTDEDGISDFIETGGDGVYDPEDGDTDPLKADTDGDGLLDGEEDINKDGVIQLGETDPGNPDTDGE